MKLKKVLLPIVVSFAVLSPVAAFAQTSGTTPQQQIQESVTSAKNMINELGGISQAALLVALVPLGSMLTLRFLNMVLSRV